MVGGPIEIVRIFFIIIFSGKSRAFLRASTCSNRDQTLRKI